MNSYFAITETYISISVYLVLHQIFVIGGEFVQAFGVPPINIGIYIDKLCSVRALLMTIADILEWSLTQEAIGDPGNTRKLGGSKPSERRILSVLSFFGLLCSRCCYLWVIYKSRNKAYVVFITLSVEGFWFGLFQMGFFAIGPEYNAFTSFALHVSGNFVLFFQELIEYFSHSRPHWNSLFRVRVHAWIAVVSSTLAWPLWTYFCRDYIQGAGEDSSFNKLVNELEKQVNAKLKDVSNADNLKNALYNALNVKEVKGKIADLLLAEFGVEVTDPTSEITVNNLGNNTVEVAIKGSGTEQTAKVTVTKTQGGSVKSDVIFIVKVGKTNSQRKRIAYKLGTALSDDKVKEAENVKNYTIDFDKSSFKGPGVENSLSALCMFPLGAFTEDFMYPGLLPYAFLDPQNANLINYTMPLFYMTGAVFVLLVNDVFHPTGFAPKIGNHDMDSWFKDWSEGEGDGTYYHYMWLLHIKLSLEPTCITHNQISGIQIESYTNVTIPCYCYQH